MATTHSDDSNDADERRALRELARSDRPTAPVYREMYIDRYDEDPVEEDGES